MPRTRRPGYLYVAVLMTSLLISAMGLTALSVAALRLRCSTASTDWTAAAALAQSAIEDAVLKVSLDNAWRTKNTHNVPSTAVSLAAGAYSWKLLDDDGNLADDDRDSVRVVGIGRVGEAVVAESVRLIPTGNPLSCLETALHCNNSVSLGLLVQLTTDQTVSTNGSLAATALLCKVTGNAEASGAISGTVTGTKTSGAPTRLMPGSSALDYYLDNGAWIEIGALPLVIGARTIQKVVISPTLNPYGSGGNPEGIYVIDCGGAQVKIKDCRIIGTLVLLNPAANSCLEGSIHWDTAVGNYPALLVTGDIELRTGTAELSETLQGVNYNPVGAPYEGVADTDKSDAYTSEISGLVYVSGRLSAPSDLLESRIRGVTVCNALTMDSSSRFNYRPLLHDYPAPGFAHGNPMQVSPGSRRRESLSP
ncbi:hypothetical protein [Pirellulimonas nuda]|nr:hypothetical protein [Pirellulimonas nuda]